MAKSNSEFEPLSLACHDIESSNEALIDHRGDLLASQSLRAGEGNQFVDLRPEGTAVDGPHDADASTSRELHQTLIAQDVQSLDDRVLVHAQFRGEVNNGRKAFTRVNLALRDRASNLSGDLEMQRSEGFT